MKKWYFLLSLGIILLAFIFRFQPLKVPFWVDEFSTAYQANLLLKFGPSIISNPNYYFEHHNVTTHVLVALFFQFFGQSEFAARFPLMIIGSFVPLLIFWLGKKVFDPLTGITASVLSIFSYFMITWSRQARGYVIQQLLVLLLFLTYFSILESKRNRPFLLFLLGIIILLGTLTHIMFMIAFGTMILHFCIFHFSELKKFLKQPFFYLCIGIFFSIIWYVGILGQVGVQVATIASGQLSNNLWYYHSFLWREYSLITFLGLIGLGLALITKKRFAPLISLYFFLQFIFLCFFFGPYVSRYLLPLFPFLLLGVAYSLTYFTNALFKTQQKWKVPQQLQKALPLILALLIIANGDKFTLKPKSYYSVNHDFREIAVIDYDQVYDLIKTKGELDKGQTAVVDTWGDRLVWYLGTEFEGSYFFRWIDGQGLMKQTSFSFNTQGEKVLGNRNQAKFMGELADLQLAMKKYPKGFIWIDDSSLPKEVLDFAEANFHKELVLDHYTLDDNPYSIWPGTLYSWGISL